jgi:hypothetical protein
MAAHAEILQDRFEPARVYLQRLLRRYARGWRRRHVQQIERWQFGGAPAEIELRLTFGIGALARRRAPRPRRDAPGRLVAIFAHLALDHGWRLDARFGFARAEARLDPAAQPFAPRGDGIAPQAPAHEPAPP